LVAQSIGQKLMARITHAAQIDLRFGDLARKLLGFRGGVGPGNLARKRSTSSDNTELE
jgi:hypothetical protein